MSKGKSSANVRPTDRGLPLDSIHQLLSARRRRYALYCLYLNENPVRLSEVADQVTDWEQHGPSSPEDRTRTYVNLYHNQVPRLDDAGVVDYHRDDQTVELGANAPQLRPYLEQAAESDLAEAETWKL